MRGGGPGLTVFVILALILGACAPPAPARPPGSPSPVSYGFLSAAQKRLLSSSPAPPISLKLATLPTPTPSPEPPTPSPEPVPAQAPPPTPRPAPPPPPAPTPAAGRQDLALAGELARLINQARAANGLPAVALNAALTSSAQKYAAFHFLNADPYALSHFLDGGPADRAAREGYTGSVAEILATSDPSAQAILDMWLSSPPHRDIIMGAMFAEIGMGCYQGPYSYGGTTLEPVLCAGEFGAP